MDGVTWSNHSGTVIIVPELEEWLWHNQASLCRYLNISNTDLEVWVEEFAKKHRTNEYASYRERKPNLVHTH